MLLALLLNEQFMHHTQINLSPRVLRVLISHFQVTSWFDSVCIVVARQVYFRDFFLHEHELLLPDFNV